MFFRLFKAKCPNCEVRGPWDDVVWEGSGWKFFYPIWPCKACGIMLKNDFGRLILTIPIYVALLLFLEIWVEDWGLLVYCLSLIIISFIYGGLQRLKVVQSSKEVTDSDNPKSAV